MHSRYRPLSDTNLRQLDIKRTDAPLETDAYELRSISSLSAHPSTFPGAAADDRRARTPSPTPSEAEELEYLDELDMYE